MAHAGLLPTQCKGFKCRKTYLPDFQCCLRKVLYEQPDFQGAKSTLEELVDDSGHACIFYPKYHCKLNFIEQVWGRAKVVFRELPKPKKKEGLLANIEKSLLSISLELIQKYAEFF